LSVLVAAVQFDFSERSFDRRSSDYVQWYNLRRPGYITILIYLVVANIQHGNKYILGAKVAGLFISAVQGISKGREGVSFLAFFSLLLGVIVAIS
jgi:hypothetical protein